MKKFYFLYFILLPAFVQAQPELGVKFGAGVNWVKPEGGITQNSSSEIGFHGGVFAQFTLPLLTLYLQPELSFSQYGGVLENDLGVSFDYDIQATVASLGIGGNFLSSHFHVEVGPDMFFIAKVTQDITTPSTSTSLEISNPRGNVFGYHVGIGTQFNRLQFDIQYQSTFNTLADTDANFKLRAIHFSLAYHLITPR